MQRRTFIKNSAFSAIALSTTGFIRFNGDRYVGDCETTTDILGPFYRPNSPERNNLVVAGKPGDKVILRGIVRQNDCKTPFKKAKIELWHCSADGVYDNESDAFLYRGTAYSDENGKYEFTTQLPVPYPVGQGIIRPAHFHLMISAPGYPVFVTQLYFNGDPHLEKDLYSASEKAVSRILPVQTLHESKQVIFDVNLGKKLKVSTRDLNRLQGIYTNETGEKAELFVKNDLLWMKNEVFGIYFEYVQPNRFAYPGNPDTRKWTMDFEFMKDGKIKMTQKSSQDQGQEKVVVYYKS